MIAFAGGGKMASAIIGGLLRSGRSDIAVADPDASARARHASMCVYDSVTDMPHGSLCVIAVKPQQIDDVLAQIARIRPRAVISIAAGVSIRRIERVLPGVPIIRAMPNLPAVVGFGITAIAGGTSGARAEAMEIFRAVGEVVEVEESMIDAVTAISGSGPAYFFLLMRELEKSACSLGLSADVARRLVLATASGAAAFARADERSFETMIADVASKGGTTERALSIFENAGFSVVVQNAVGAAHDRAKELAA